jgi:hypothetical protein
VSYKRNAFHSNENPERNGKAKTEQQGSFDSHDPVSRSRVAPPALDGTITVHQEVEIQKAIAWFTSYLNSERESYYTYGQPLRGEWRASVEAFFATSLLDRVRIVELVDRRVRNPWFYPYVREKGITDLPDITHKSTVTFLDVVVFNGPVTRRDLFHGLVHVAQVDVLGLTEFTDLFVRGFLRARSYFLVPLKAQAFGLDAKFAANPERRFSVEKEIREWQRSGRY